MQFRILLGLALCAAATLRAQTTNSPPTPRSLSLRGCIDMALVHNLNLRIQHLAVEAARAGVTVAYGPYDPTLTAGANKHFESDLGDFDPRKFNPYFPTDLTAEKVSADLSGKIPFGFSYDFSGEVKRTGAVTDFRSDIEDAGFFYGGIRSTNDYNAQVGLSMRQHLLKDFWIDSDREVLLARRTDLKISEQALRLQIMTTMLAVELAYYELIGARQEIRVQENALNLRKQFVADTERRVQVGDLPQLEDAQAQTQLQNTLTTLAKARERFAVAQTALIGLLTDEYRNWLDVDVEPADPLKALPAEINRARSFQSAIESRPDLIQARLAVEKSNVMVKFRFNQLFPALDMVGGYGGLGSEPESGGAALGDSFGFHNPEYTYGIVATFPLANVAARGNYRASKEAKQIAELQLRQAEQAILLQISDLINRVDSRFSQVASTRQARAYAEQALDAETKKFQNGFTTSFVVLQYQEILTAARSAEIDAMVDYNKILAQLSFAEGTILERHHVTLAVK